MMRLHHKHGLNPSLSVCWLCGKDKNEVILAGLFGGKEAPHRAVWSLDPCGACKEEMKERVFFVESTDEQEPTQGMTGRVAKIRDEAVRHLITPPELAQDVLQKRMCFVQPEALEAIIARAHPDDRKEVPS